MFASLSTIGIALKLDELGRRALLAVPGPRPLQYKPSDPPSRSYVLLPPDLCADPDRLRSWMQRSVASIAHAPRAQDPGQADREVSVPTGLSCISTSATRTP